MIKFKKRPFKRPERFEPKPIEIEFSDGKVFEVIENESIRKR